MVDAAPFRALRYDPAIAGDPASTSAPAYDDLERFLYARHRTASPYTVLELLAEGAAADYREATAAFARWRRTGVIAEDPEPAYYRYDIHELRHDVPTVLRGVLAAVALDTSGLLVHERVDPARVAARVRRLDAVPVDLAPVFAVHTAAGPPLRTALDAPPQSPPLIALTDEAGADHRVWRLDEPRSIRAITDGLRELPAVIADGHHRYEAAVQFRAQFGGGERILVYLVDGSVHGPELRAVHRLVRAPTPEFGQRLSRDFTFTPVAEGGIAALNDRLSRVPGAAFGIVEGTGAGILAPRAPAELTARLPAASEAWQALDTAVWAAAVHPLVGGEVEFRSDLPAAAAEVARDPDTVLFVLRPPSMAAVYACASAGDVMPVKTTWFRPKPRAGLIMRSLD